MDGTNGTANSNSLSNNSSSLSQIPKGVVPNPPKVSLPMQPNNLNMSYKKQGSKLVWIIVLCLFLLAGVVGILIKIVQSEQSYSSSSNPNISYVNLQNSSSVNLDNPKKSTSSGQINGGLSLNNAAITISVNSIVNHRVSGFVTVSNNSLNNFAKLYLDYVIQTPPVLVNVDTKSGKISRFGSINDLTSVESDSFTLLAGENKNIPFSIPYSSNIPSGKYKLLVSLINPYGSIVTFTSTEIASLDGLGRFLDTTPGSCLVTTGDKQYDSNIGAPINPNDQIKAQCNFTNNTSTTISVYPQITYAERSVIGYPVSEKKTIKSNDIFVISPNDTKIITFSLPSQLKPQIYQANFILLSKPGDVVSSYPVLFRWTVKGPSGFIGDATLNKELFNKGDSAIVQFPVSPSMDLFWRNDPLGSPTYGTSLLNAKISVSLSSNGVLCGQAEKILPVSKSFFTWGDSQKLTVPINKTCPNPDVKANLTENGQIIASYDRVFLANSIPTPKTQISSNNYQIKLLLICIIIVLLFTILILTYVMFFKKKSLKLPVNPPHLHIMLFFIVELISFLIFVHIFSKPVFATKQLINGNYQLWTRRQDAYNCPPNGCDPTYPIYGYESYLPGYTITLIDNHTVQFHFQGTITQSNCGNIHGAFHLFPYINGQQTSDMNFNYGSFSTPISWLNQDGGHYYIEVADTGVNNPSCSGSGNSPVYIDQTFTITKNSGFNGTFTASLDVDLVFYDGCVPLHSYHDLTDSEYARTGYGGACGRDYGGTAQEGCYATQTQTFTIAHPAPNISKPACFANPESGSGITISWDNTNLSPVTYVDISTDPNFGTFYNKPVSGTSTTGDGFSSNGLTLTYSPNTTYYARLWDNYNHSPSATFAVNACVHPAPNVSTPACFTNPDSGSGINISWSNTNLQPVAVVDMSTDPNFSSFYNKGVSGTSTTGDGFRHYPDGASTLTYSPNTTYYTRLWDGYNHSPNTTVNPVNVCLPSVSVSCSTNPSPNANVNQPVTWSANATGGDGTYSYNWSGSFNLRGPQSYTTSYSSAGVQNENITASSAGSSATASCSVTIGNTPATLGNMTITKGGDANLSQGTQGFSGLRSDTAQGGSNYNNSIHVHQDVNPGSDSSTVSVIGVGFLNSAGTPTDWPSLLNLANNKQGFVFRKDVNGYEVFYNNQWSSSIPINRFYLVTNEIIVQPINLPCQNGLNTCIDFNVWFYKNLGTKNWNTYGILTDSVNNVLQLQNYPNP